VFVAVASCFRLRMEGVHQVTQSMPTEYTCEGANVSPPLVWERPPAGTKSFALIVEDPDSIPLPGFVHWIVANIPSTARYLQRNITIHPLDTVKEGMNGLLNLGWTGPCNRLSQHNYVFRLYALANETVPVPKKFQRKDLEYAIRRASLAPPASLTVVFAGTRTSGGVAHYPPQKHAAPPAPPPRPTSPSQPQGTSANSNSGLAQAARPNPSVVAASKNDNTLVGGGISVKNPTDIAKMRHDAAAKHV